MPYKNYPKNKARPGGKYAHVKGATYGRGGAVFLKNGQELHERKGVDIFTKEKRDEMHRPIPRRSFTDYVLDDFNSYRIKPEDLVHECKVYYKRRYDEQIAKGVKRATHWLSSASSELSRLKKRIKQLRLAPYKYYRQISLTKREQLYLEKLKHKRLEESAHNLPAVDAKKLLNLLYGLLDSDDPRDLVIAVCGLTGRRQTEVTHKTMFTEPTSGLRHRYPSMWSRQIGFVKQREWDRYAVRARELPMLAPRRRILGAVRNIREQWPSDSVKQAGNLYSARIAQHVRVVLKPLGVPKLHDLRKSFAPIAHKYFNERGSGLPAFTSMVLGQKRTLGKTVMTYLLARIENIPEIDWMLQQCESGLCAGTPEQVIETGTPVYVTPVNTDSEPDEPAPTERKAPPERKSPPRERDERKTSPREERKDYDDEKKQQAGKPPPARIDRLAALF